MRWNELQLDVKAKSATRAMVMLGGLALQACGGDDAGAPSSPTSPPAMSPAVTSSSGATSAGGTPAAAATPRPASAGRTAPPPREESPPRAGKAAPPSAGASAGRAGDTSAEGGKSATGGTAPSGTLGGKLMFTGELTKDSVIPQKYKCLMPRIGGAPGENISPPLEWSGGPANTQSFALIVYDITYSQFHWAVWDIPATVNALPEGVPTGYDLPEPAGAHQFNAIARATDEHMYYGPCSGGPMAGTYEFRLFALDKPELELTEMSDVQAVQRAIEEAQLEKVIWAGMPD